MPIDTADSRLNQLGAPMAYSAASVSTIASLTTRALPPSTRSVCSAARTAYALGKLGLALLAVIVITLLSAPLGDLCVSAGGPVCGP